MKTRLAILLTLLITSTASAADLPWPAVAAGTLYLPFGQQFYEMGQKGKIKGYGEPECTETRCRWMADRPDGTVIFWQEYHYGALMGFGLQYILKKESGLPYKEKLRVLRGKLEEWIITAPRDPLPGSETFEALSRTVILRAEYRGGEQSITVTLDTRTR